MGLFQRKRYVSSDGISAKSASAVEAIEGNSNRSRNRGRIYYILSEVVIGILLIKGGIQFMSTASSHIKNYQIKGNGYGVQIDFLRGAEGLPTLGPHSVYVDMDADTSCENELWARAVGDALVLIPMTQDHPNRFIGTFNLPIGGNYSVEILWKGCTGSKNETQTQRYAFEAYGSPLLHQEKEDRMFANGAWIRSEKLQYRIDGVESSMELDEYLWADPSKVIQGKEMTGVEYNGKVLLRDGVVTDEHGFFQFKALSNYELVCWVGSDSAKRSREAFLALRPKLFPSQRPFKFHLYDSSSLVNPDATWTDEAKKGFRKCKHVLISIEPEDLLSQRDYKTQMNRFLWHVVTAIDDETFPIWVFTSVESPVGSRNCYDPFLQRTSDHPCNDVLKDIFRDSPFSSRVQLLDNTDLSLPHFDESGAVFAAIAMRIYVLVGKQVAHWRDNGQRGHVKGLTRGDVEYPNFPLLPYNWSSDLPNKNSTLRMQ